MNILEIYLIITILKTNIIICYLTSKKFHLRNSVTIKHNIVNGKYKSTAQNVLMYLPVLCCITYSIQCLLDIYSYLSLTPFRLSCSLRYEDVLLVGPLTAVTAGTSTVCDSWDFHGL